VKSKAKETKWRRGCDIFIRFVLGPKYMPCYCSFFFFPFVSPLPGLYSINPSTSHSPDLDVSFKQRKSAIVAVHGEGRVSYPRPDNRPLILSNQSRLYLKRCPLKTYIMMRYLINRLEKAHPKVRDATYFSKKPG